MHGEGCLFVAETSHGRCKKQAPGQWRVPPLSGPWPEYQLSSSHSLASDLPEPGSGPQVTGHPLFPSQGRVSSCGKECLERLPPSPGHLHLLPSAGGCKPQGLLGRCYPPNKVVHSCLVTSAPPLTAPTVARGNFSTSLLCSKAFLPFPIQPTKTWPIWQTQHKSRRQEIHLQ